ncbi:MAG: hypothetical protein LR015_14320 [Verrucomicrobia bacterium]|nr:hypothetical protein [Verrucomicrobiota bacterium]
MPVLLLLCTLAIHASLLHVLFVQTIAHEQLLHAFFVLTLAGALIAYEHKSLARPQWDFSNTVIGLLAGNYALMFAAWLSGLNLLLIPALCLALAAIGIFVLGPQSSRVVAAWVTAFGAFILLAFLLPALDWPLRGLAALGAHGHWIDRAITGNCN